MAKFRQGDDADIGAKKYERLNPWKTDLYALFDDDEETAGRKSGTRTQKRRFATAIKTISNSETRQKAKKQLEMAAQDIAKQLGIEGMFTPEALARIADRVKKDKVNSDQQIVMLASGQMPAGVPGWLESEIRKQKANVEYQVMAANPIMLRILMQNAPQMVMQQIAQRIGFLPDVAQRDWVQDFLAADKRERAVALEMEKKNKLHHIPGNAEMHRLPHMLDMNLHTGLKALDWANMRQGLTLAGAFEASTRDMHGLMNAQLRQDAALKVYANAPVTRPFAEAEMSLRETKMLYSKLHMKGFDDGQIARTAHVAVALAEVRRDVDPRASRGDSDFQRNVYNNIVRDLKSANQNEIVRPLPVERVASYVAANADGLRGAMERRELPQSDVNQLASRSRLVLPQPMLHVDNDRLALSRSVDPDGLASRSRLPVTRVASIEPTVRSDLTGLGERRIVSVDPDSLAVRNRLPVTRVASIEPPIRGDVTGLGDRRIAHIDPDLLASRNRLPVVTRVASIEPPIRGDVTGLGERRIVSVEPDSLAARNRLPLTRVAGIEPPIRGDVTGLGDRRIAHINPDLLAVRSRLATPPVTRASLEPPINGDTLGDRRIAGVEPDALAARHRLPVSEAIPVDRRIASVEPDTLGSLSRTPVTRVATVEPPVRGDVTAVGDKRVAHVDLDTLATRTRLGAPRPDAGKKLDTPTVT